MRGHLAEQSTSSVCEAHVAWVSVCRVSLICSQCSLKVREFDQDDNHVKPFDWNLSMQLSSMYRSTGREFSDAARRPVYGS